MPRRPLISHAAITFAQNASRQLASLQRDWQALGDRMAGLQQSIKAPVPAGGTRYIKGSRSRISPFVGAAESSVGSLIAGGLLDQFGISSGAGSRASFYLSSAQSGAGWLSALALGQRIS